MSEKPVGSKIKNILLILALSPVFLVSAFLGIAWFIDFQAQCGLSLSYSCGMDKSSKAAIFGFVAVFSGVGIKNSFNNLKK